MYKKGTNTAQDTFIPRNHQMLVNDLDGGRSSRSTWAMSPRRVLTVQQGHHTVNIATNTTSTSSSRTSFSSILSCERAIVVTN